MGLDRHVGLWVGDASENEALPHLLVVKEGSVGLVNCSISDKTGAAAASTSSAGVRKVKAGFLGGIEDVGTLIALDDLLAIWSHEGHAVGHLDVCSGDAGGGESTVEVVPLEGGSACGVRDRIAWSAAEHLDSSSSSISHLGLGCHG